jgi:hypothetical protein
MTEDNVHDLTPALLRDIRDEIRGLRAETREGFEHQRLLLATVLEGHEHAAHATLRHELDEIKRRLAALEGD